ncbi:MAG: 50S ribosomal protein L9 [Pyrinomonadaceae bacterium]
MSTTKILLREDVDNLGGRGEIVKVKAGYARNYLIPQKIATLATKGNVNQIAKEREALLKKAAVEKSTADAQAGQMSGISLEFVRKAGESGALFGSVTSMDIAEALKAKGYDFDRRKIVLKDTIKETGEYTVNVKLHREVTVEIPVTVRGEGEEAKPKETAPAETETTRETDEPTETSTEETES